MLYDLENLVWVKMEGDVARIGATSILAALAGKLTKVSFRLLGANYDAGRSLGTIESLRYVGALRTPLSGKLIEGNGRLLTQPKLLNNSPYEDGWFARMHLTQPEEIGNLKRIDSLQEEVARKILELRVRCFKAYPDHELYEIGVECAATLVRLNETMLTIPKGEVVHVVTDDPTAYVEMVRWTEQTGNRLLDWREEEKISHFLVEKTK